MSKRKMSRFRLKKGEILVKQGGIDYAPAGTFAHSMMGYAYLTNERLHFDSDGRSGYYLTFEIPIADIIEIGKTGIPVLTRSIVIITDEKRYRFNVFPIGGLLKKLHEVKRAYDEARAAARRESIR